MRHVSIVLFFVALLFCANDSALCADIYYEQWDGGTIAGWGPVNGSSTVAVEASGGNPGGCLSMYGISNDTARIGAAVTLPGATGDYWAKGIGLVSFDVKFVGESSMQALIRIRPAGAGQNGWLFRLPLAVGGAGAWSAVTAGINGAWDDTEAILAGWIKEASALSFHETMGQVAAVEVLFLSVDAVDARIDNFCLGSSMHCMEDLPAPVLAFKGTSVAGDFEIRWNFSIENWYDFPGELFLLEPELPPCGRRRGAPRTYVRFFRSNGKSVAELCSVMDPSQLQDIGFIADLSGSPSMYVELYDRYCNLVYRSNTVSTGSSNSPPEVHAGPDMTVECSGPTTPVTVDGSRSVDPDGDDVVFEWYAKNVVFDDPSAPVTTGHFPVGTHLVVLKVSDEFTYKTDVVQVRVVDTRPPDLRVELSYSMLWPPNHKYLDVHADVSANDCDPSAHIALTSIFLKGGGQGGFKPEETVRNAEFGTNDADFQLLCERKGYEAGGTYGIVFVAWDAMFHMAVETVYVEIPHDRSGGKGQLLSDAPPSGPSLDRAYPNPFNPVVNLTYSIPAGGTVKLAVYDVSGRAVRSLVAEQKSAGTFTTVWNALDDGGMRVPAGVYFVRFQFGGDVQTRKIVLLH